VKETTYKNYENGKEIPGNPVIARLEQILGAKLPRPKIQKN
jgi:ribosome-binding protein aMBF1 (putative translation factor)